MVGAVGAGKSALLSALTGGMDATRGTMHVRGSVAFVAQRPFLLSASVRDNILFGRPFDAERYARVLDACALTADVADMAAGDGTVVGPRGLSLSGGQRARVALARAAYSDAQVVLLDDPLAAVDGAVASHLMARCIGPSGVLSDRVVLMATNALEQLRGLPRVVLLREGQVVEEGSFEALATRGGEFATLLAISNQQHGSAGDGTTTTTVGRLDPGASGPSPPPQQAPIAAAAQAMAGEEAERQPADTSGVPAATTTPAAAVMGEGSSDGDAAEAAAEGFEALPPAAPAEVGAEVEVGRLLLQTSVQ